mmetsp:Transcript_2768/g.3814  ORF Transcript_2768/g.3814 Transcript_2768/m.3814 type:complete len:276 (-) Transcript_2768:7-834(-)
MSDGVSSSLAHRLKVSNLSPSVQTEHLEEIFGCFGQVTNVQIGVEKELCPGSLSQDIIAFVDFATLSDANEALRCLDLGSLDGRQLKVIRLQHEDERPSLSSVQREQESRSDRHSQNRRLKDHRFRERPAEYRGTERIQRYYPRRQLGRDGDSPRGGRRFQQQSRRKAFSPSSDSYDSYSSSSSSRSYSSRSSSYSSRSSSLSYSSRPLSSFSSFSSSSSSYSSDSSPRGRSYDRSGRINSSHRSPSSRRGDINCRGNRPSYKRKRSRSQDYQRE